MERILFSNRMGGKNLVHLAAGYVIAVIVILWIRGARDIGPILAVLAGLTALGVIAIWFIFTVVAKNQIAELKRVGDTLSAEIVHISGKGRKVEMPVPGPQDWGYRTQGVGTRGTKKVAVLTLKSAGTTFTLPLFGAQVVDLEGLQALAPKTIDELQALNLIRKQPA